MLTFYRHGGIRVTDEWITVDGRRYPLRECDDLRVTRGPVRRPAVWVLGSSGTLLAMTVALSPALPGLMVAALGLAGFLAAGLAAVLTRLQRREQRLWVRYQGEPLLLLATTDDIELGKLSRAVRRALERDARFQRLSRRSRLLATAA
jgi:hypothetical protein